MTLIEFNIKAQNPFEGERDESEFTMDGESGLVGSCVGSMDFWMDVWMCSDYAMIAKRVYDGIEESRACTRDI